MYFEIIFTFIHNVGYEKIHPKALKLAWPYKKIILRFKR